MIKRAILVGGFTTSKDQLEPVADAICVRFGFNDADIFKFTDVIEDTSPLERALRRQAVFVHSAGLLAVAKCTGMERVTSFNSPEPTSLERLIGGAAISGLGLLKMAITGPHNLSAARIAAGSSVEAVINSAAHIRQLKNVSRFSTTKQLGLMRSAGVRTAQIDCDNDDIFGPYKLQAWDGKRAVLPGRHDQVLINPTEFLAQLPQEALTPNRPN